GYGRRSFQGYCRTFHQYTDYSSFPGCFNNGCPVCHILPVWLIDSSKHKAPGRKFLQVLFFCLCQPFSAVFTLIRWMVTPAAMPNSSIFIHNLSTIKMAEKPMDAHSKTRA